MSFKQTDRVKVINTQHSKVGELGTVTHVFEDAAYVVLLDSGNHSGFFESELEAFDDQREKLIELAETLDKARKQANDINGCDGDIYRSISGSLYSVLGILVADEDLGYQIYTGMRDSGSTVREALAVVGK